SESNRRSEHLFSLPAQSSDADSEVRSQSNYVCGVTQPCGSRLLRVLARSSTGPRTVFLRPRVAGRTQANSAELESALALQEHGILLPAGEAILRHLRSRAGARLPLRRFSEGAALAYQASV